MKYRTLHLFYQRSHFLLNLLLSSFPLTLFFFFKILFHRQGQGTQTPVHFGDSPNLGNIFWVVVLQSNFNGLDLVFFDREQRSKVLKEALLLLFLLLRGIILKRTKFFRNVTKNVRHGKNGTEYVQGNKKCSYKM